MMKWIMFGATTVGLVVVGLYVYRKVNPKVDPVQAQYVNETDKSKIEVGPATITPLSGKKTWDATSLKAVD